MNNETNKETTNQIIRIYNIRITQQLKKAPRWRRAKKAVSLIKKFLERHMKTKNIKLSKRLNEYIWKNGGKNPPTYYKIKVIKKGEEVEADFLEIEKQQRQLKNKPNQKLEKNEKN